MAFRAVYIINSNGDYPQSILFKRTFPIIERKCKQEMGDKYVEIPLQLASLIADKLEINRNEEFIQKYDSVLLKKTPPVYTLADGAIKPVVAFYKNGCMFCCIAYDKSLHSTQDTEALTLSPAVSFAYTMLENMANYIGSRNSIENLQSKLQSLHKYVTLGFPFGIPSELNVDTVLSKALYADGGVIAPKLKSPAWRPVSFKGKQTMQLEISEIVKAIQFDSKDILDVCEIFGTIQCKADVEDSPEISFDYSAPLNSTVHSQILYHPCVQLVDDVNPIMKTNEMNYGSRKLRFCPPNNNFAVCHYRVKLSEDDFPVKAYFQMKGDSRTVTILIQLQLSEKMKNNFETFEVVIPFFNRGPVVDIKSSLPNLNLHPERSKLIWNVGQRFSSKGADKILEATITFDITSGVLKPDPLLVGVNSYIMMYWKVSDFTYSGLRFENKSVELYPSSKIKVNSTTTFQTMEYKVWNSHGDVTDTSFNFSFKM